MNVFDEIYANAPELAWVKKQAGSPVAWNECTDPRWMLRVAALTGVDRKLVLFATCQCMRLRWADIPQDGQNAIEGTERWCLGSFPLDELQAIVWRTTMTSVWTFGKAFSDSPFDGAVQFAEMLSFISDVCAAAWAKEKLTVASHCSAGAWAAADNWGDASISGRGAYLMAMPDIVRKYIPWKAICST